jgi:hypoxanthine phosphoribosyltransferase
MLHYQDLLHEILVPADMLQDRIRVLGETISRDYAPICERGERLLLLCLLRGGVVFLSDLMRRLSVPHEIDFMAISSYGIGARASTGTVRITLDAQHSIANTHVLIVEDIVDSGYTLSQVSDLLATRRPASLKICALLDKASRRTVPVPLDYVGFQIPDKFVFGYGLDVDELFRNAPFIGVVKPDWKRD